VYWLSASCNYNFIFLCFSVWKRVLWFPTFVGFYLSFTEAKVLHKLALNASPAQPSHLVGAGDAQAVLSALPFLFTSGNLLDCNKPRYFKMFGMFFTLALCM